MHGFVCIVHVVVRLWRGGGAGTKLSCLGLAMVLPGFQGCISDMSENSVCRGLRMKSYAIGSDEAFTHLADFVWRDEIQLTIKCRKAIGLLLKRSLTKCMDSCALCMLSCVCGVVVAPAPSCLV